MGWELFSMNILTFGGKLKSLNQKYFKLPEDYVLKYI